MTGTLRYWIEQSEHECGKPLPIGSCFKCDMLQLERERDAAQELLREIRDDEVNAQDECDKFLRDHEPSELSKVIEQRDDAIEMMNRTRDNSGQIIASQAAENIILTQQRDSLAEALQRIRNGYGGQMTDPDCGCEDCEFLIKIDTALQFLTPNKS